MVEEWRDIPGYICSYQVSNLGRVRSIDREIKYKDGRTITQKGRILSTRIDKNGYERVGLNKNTTSKLWLVHRLVALAFVDIIQGKNYVDHIDGNRANNHVENLRWCTIAENNDFPIAVQNRIKSAAKLEKKILQYDMNFNLIQEHSGANAAGRLLGICNSHITECCQGKRRSIGGYIWRYKL